MCFAQHNILRLTKIYKIIYKIGKTYTFFNVKNPNGIYFWDK